MKENKHIEKMIRDGLKFEEPSKDFTDGIMKQIKAVDAQQEMALGSLLKKNAMEQPSTDFTDRIMAQVISANKVAKNEPLISRKVWMLITVFVVSIFIYGLLLGESNSTHSTEIEQGIRKVEGLFSSSVNLEMPALLTSPLFGLGIFALALLLVTDYYWNNRKVASSSLGMF